MEADWHINRTLSHSIISHDIPDATMGSDLGETKETASKGVPILA